MSDQGEWPARSLVPRLNAGTIHLWTVDLDELLPQATSRREVLTSVEIARAERFRFERDRARYIVGRGLLRSFLSSYDTAGDAGGVRLRYGPHGKPALDRTSREPGLHFNLAHCGGVALYGFSRSVDLGVDIEHVHEMDDMDDVMRTSFAPAERDAIRALSPDARPAAFFRCWTRKEAVLKSLGSGLAKPLDSFVVSVDDPAARLLSMDGEPRASSLWQLRHVVPKAGFVGAVAWIGAPLALEHFSYAA